MKLVMMRIAVTLAVCLAAVSASAQDTTWFGGTAWDPVDARWEALPGGTWTFDTGVGSSFTSGGESDPFKDPALHTRMEGWVGVDRTRNPDSRFRRMTAADFAPGDPVCVGAGAGLEGSASLWAGWTGPEADAACWASGQGYGNGWRALAARSFVYPGSGSVTLSFDYVNDTEPGFDYTHVEIDTGGTDPVRLVSYQGAVFGSAAFTLHPGVGLPAGPGSFTIRFLVETDGAYSDEDGFHATSCGAFAVDRIELGGAVTHVATFETGDDGWGQAPVPGVGDWTDIVSLAALGPVPGDGCGLADSVLLFVERDSTGGYHKVGQQNVVESPWIDLEAAGAVGRSERVLQYRMASTVGALNYVAFVTYVRYSPYVCPATGGETVSPWLAPFSYYLGPFGQMTCTDDAPRTHGLGGLVPPGARSVQLRLGIAVNCGFFGNCEPSTTTTPWIDDIRFGVFDATTSTPPVPETPAPALRLVSPHPLVRGRLALFAATIPGSFPVGLRVYDVTGRRVRSLDSGGMEPGVRTLTWNLEDDAGRPVAAGLYLVRLRGPVPATVRVLVLP